MSIPQPARAHFAQITEFLTHKRIAVIGVSRDPKDFTRSLCRLFERNGYEVVPVNPHATEIDGLRCFARIRDVDPPLDTAVVLTSPAASEQVVRECAQSGISRIWLYGTSNLKTVNSSAVAFCREHGIDVIPGECPFMFLGSFPHRVHGFVNKVIGIYPR